MPLPLPSGAYTVPSPPLDGCAAQERQTRLESESRLHFEGLSGRLSKQDSHIRHVWHGLQLLGDALQVHPDHGPTMAPTPTQP